MIRFESVIKGVDDWSGVDVKVSGDEEIKNQEASKMDVYSTWLLMQLRIMTATEIERQVPTFSINLTFQLNELEK